MYIHVLVELSVVVFYRLRCLVFVLVAPIVGVALKAVPAATGTMEQVARFQSNDKGRNTPGSETLRNTFLQVFIS